MHSIQAGNLLIDKHENYTTPVIWNKSKDWGLRIIGPMITLYHLLQHETNLKARDSEVH